MYFESKYSMPFLCEMQDKFDLSLWLVPFQNQIEISNFVDYHRVLHNSIL